MTRILFRLLRLVLAQVDICFLIGSQSANASLLLELLGNLIGVISKVSQSLKYWDWIFFACMFRN